LPITQPNTRRRRAGQGSRSLTSRGESCRSGSLRWGGPGVRRAAQTLARNGATLVAGHSAHVFHGVAGRVLFDLGDFIDDYRVDPILRNDLGLLWFVDLDGGQLGSVEAVPLKLDYCHTRIAEGDEAAWITRSFIDACGALGTPVREHAGRLVVGPPPIS
jgi:poly-gamma-glutamate synthesis protein (capsule biosynthesis protein)